VPLENLGGNPQIFDAPIGAGTDVHLIDGGADQFGHVFDIVRLVSEGGLRRQCGDIMRHDPIVYGIFIRCKAAICLQRGFGRVEIIFYKWPQVVHRGPVRRTDAASGTGFHGHVAQRHTLFHRHGADDGAVEFDHLVSGAVDTQTTDDRKDHILGKYAGR